MKRILTLLALALCLNAAAQPFPARHDGAGRQPVRRANYALAERFSQKKVSQMVYSPRIRPSGVS